MRCSDPGTRSRSSQISTARLGSFWGQTCETGITGKRLQCGLLQLLIRHPFARRRERQGRPVEHIVQFDAEDENTAADADDQQIQADGDSAPQMDLKQCLACPDGLRAAPDPFNQPGRFAHCVPCTYRLGFRRSSRPTMYRTTVNMTSGISPNKSE